MVREAPEGALKELYISESFAKKEEYADYLKKFSEKKSVLSRLLWKIFTFLIKN